MNAEGLLSQLGLSGAYQVHVAPVLLRPDLRAHQVFIGFDDLSPLRFLLPPSVEVLVVEEDGSRVATGLSGLAGRIAVIPAQSDENPGGLYGLVWVVDRLLGPGGCPWDREQTHQTLKKYLLEEAYELIQAIEDEDAEKMVEELGDVLLQPVMHAQMQAIEGNYDIDHVANKITEKLVRRHPHVFDGARHPEFVEGSTRGSITSDQVLQNWDEIKKQEKGEPQSVLSGVPRSLPALLRALEVSKRAARSGFEWPNEEGVWEKLREEERELKEAKTKEEEEQELGDLLFTVVNLARWRKIDPEEALRRMLDRFTSRFVQMESQSRKPLKDLTPAEWDELWEAAKSS